MLVSDVLHNVGELRMLHKRKAVTMTRVSTRCLHGALGLEIRQYTKGCRP